MLTPLPRPQFAHHRVWNAYLLSREENCCCTVVPSSGRSTYLSPGEPSVYQSPAACPTCLLPPPHPHRTAAHTRISPLSVRLTLTLFDSPSPHTRVHVSIYIWSGPLYLNLAKRGHSQNILIEVRGKGGGTVCVGWGPPPDCPFSHTHTQSDASMTALPHPGHYTHT